VTGGTDNPIVLWDVCATTGLIGFKVARVLKLAEITVNKNGVPGDVWLCAPALMSQGLDTEDFDQVAGFLYRWCALVVKAQDGARAASDDPAGRKMLLRVFKAALKADKALIRELEELKEEVELFASGFYMPG
jgi:glycine hydroxymethyltransferase